MEEGNDQSSPIPEKDEAVETKLLTFPEAADALAIGRRVGKRDWDEKEPGNSAQLIGSRLKLIKPDGKTFDWVLSDGDLTGEDYYIINE